MQRWAGERLTCSGLPHHHRVGRIRRICVASGVMCLPPIPGLPETGEKFPRQLKHLDAVVQLKLYRMRSHTHAVIFFATQCDVRINCFVSEHATGFQELAVQIQFVQCFFQRAYRFLSMASPGWILFLIPSRPAISRAAKHRYGLAAGSGKRTSIRRAFGEETTGIRIDAERLRAE